MIKYLILLLMPVLAVAQKQHDIWHFGRGCSMYFNNGSLVSTTGDPSVRPHEFSQYIYKVATMCDKRTGALLFYTNGQGVMNRNHQLMPGGQLGGPATRVVIVPDPLDSMQYVIIYAVSLSSVRYAKVNMRLNNGLGGITVRDQLISNDVDSRFVVVNQLYGYGTWLVAHSWTQPLFYAYRITGEGVGAPVVSAIAGPARVPDPIDSYSGEMVATTDGSLIAYTFRDAPGNYLLGIYNFDRQCGKITYNQHLDNETMYFSVAFDHTGQFLYSASWDNSLVQFDLFSSAPQFSKTPVAQNAPTMPLRAMRLAPDNRIYITTEEITSGPGGGLSPSRRLHRITSPWVKGTGCNYELNAIMLDRGTVCPGGAYCQITSVLPDFIADRTTSFPGFEQPEVKAERFCLGDTTLFEVTGNFAADSVKWVFGDGDSVYARNAAHLYSVSGNYTAVFKWYLCGFEYKRIVPVPMAARPVANLGEDTTLCAGTTISLSGPAADGYQWSTGDTSQQITVTAAGVYSLEVRNGGCSATDEISVSYYPSLWISLGDEYFICNDEHELTKLDAGEGFSQYKWTPTGDTTQWIEVADLGAYFVVVKDFRGCQGNDGTVVNRRCPVKVYFPNAFTPNNDGLNDRFEPVGKDVTSFELSVYNSWGELVFYTNAITHAWDGTYRNKPAPAGTYIYKAHYAGYRNKKPVSFDVKGNVTLLR